MRTFKEFQHHIELHRERVSKLGLALAKIHYSGLNLKTLESFLALHDHSKTLMDFQRLQKYDYKHSLFPAERLFRFYGKTPTNNQETLQLIDVINDINAIDEDVCVEFFKMHPELPWGTQETFYTIEKVADLVDRSLDPIAAEEFGHPMVLASEFVQDPYMAMLSMWLETHYHQITKDLSFSKQLCYKIAE